MFHSVHERLGGQIEFLVSGGAPIAPELIKKWELLGIPIIQGYGATEASPVISATTLNNRDPHTVGQPVPGMQVKVAKDGEVLIKGPSITQGYWNNPEATREAFEDGWYKTGDLGQIDEKGRIYLHGRKKDMIVLANGQNVYPEDVELVLKSIPGLVDAVVVGLPSERGAQVHAVIIPDPEGVNADRVVKQANARLAPHQYIRGITVWPDKDFPRTHTLKVKKHEVLKRLIEMYAPKEEHEQAVVAAAN
jgi:long-chain acyl-CoA synthetase